MIIGGPSGRRGSGERGGRVGRLVVGAFPRGGGRGPAGRPGREGGRAGGGGVVWGRGPGAAGGGLPARRGSARRGSSLGGRAAPPVRGGAPLLYRPLRLRRSV